MPAPHQHHHPLHHPPRPPAEHERSERHERPAGCVGKVPGDARTGRNPGSGGVHGVSPYIKPKIPEVGAGEWYARKGRRALAPSRGLPCGPPLCFLGGSFLFRAAQLSFFAPQGGFCGRLGGFCGRLAPFRSCLGALRGRQAAKTCCRFTYDNTGSNEVAEKRKFTLLVSLQ